MNVLETMKAPHLLSVAEYMTLETQGRTELLGGIIYDVSPRNEPHRYAVRKLAQYLSRGLKPRYIVQPRDAVAVPDWLGKDAPEDDLSVLTEKFYRPAPTAADAHTFIEVSDSSYADDRKYKIPLYVNPGVPSWIINISLRQAEFYGSAADLALPHGNVFTENDSVDVLGVSMAVADLFDVKPESESA